MAVIETEYEAKKIIEGDETVNVGAGNSIASQLTSEIKMLSSSQCPAGKAWIARIYVRIEETVS